MSGRFPYHKEKENPNDGTVYEVSSCAIELTEQVLRDYGRYDPPNEGLVYWGGHKLDSVLKVSVVIAPFAESHSLRVVSSNTSNAKVVSALVDRKCVYLAQVHSHPEEWVDHSDGDDEWAAFKHNGLLSIVVPYYCKNGISPLTNCGIHRFHDRAFVRLSERYIENHFRITFDERIEFLDMR